MDTQMGWLLGLGLAVTAAGASAFEDDFSRYPDGSAQAGPWWFAGAFWEPRGGQLVAEERDRSVALLTNAAPGRMVTLEVTVTVSNACATGWKVAGAGVYLDERHFWHLALVESPDATGSKRFVELSEMHDGIWNAHHEAATRLRALEDSRPLEWQPGRPYRMQVELGAEVIRGTVRAADGTLVARIAYALEPGKAVREGRPILDSGGFRAAFDDFRAEVSDPVAQEPAPLRPPPPFDLAGTTQFQARATGFFRVEQAGRHWWLVTPKGQGFFATGVDHANYFAHGCETLGYAPYHRNMAAAFGTEERWAESTRDRLQAWGFNTLGAGASAGMRHRGLAHTEFLSFGSEFAGYSDIVPKVHWTGFPNVFHPRFQRYCEWRAEQVCAAARNDPWLLGYFLDNELEWYGKSGREEGLLEEALRKPAAHEAKVALAALLRERHRTVEALNAAWGTRYADWPTFGQSTNVPASGPAVRADADVFLALCAERYFATTCQAVRRFDPNHLILGSRFAGQAPEPAWRACWRHVDVVSVNVYPRVNLAAAALVKAEDDLRRWHEWTGRPLMVTEWSFPALDSGLPCVHGAGMRVDTQAQRALCCAVMQEALFRLPFVVGSDFFMWVDEPAAGISSTFPEDSNYGLVNERNEPYALLTAMFAQLNPQAPALHAGAAGAKSVAGALQRERLAKRDARPTGARTNTAAVVFRRTADGYEADNGVLRLVKNGPDGAIFDRIEIAGVEAGSFWPVLWQKLPANAWTRPDVVESVRDTRLADGALQLDVTARARGAQGFAVTYRVVVPPGAAWFSSQLRSVEGAGELPWTLAGYYHYALSSIGGNAADDEVADAGVPNYWLPFGMWRDAAADVNYGVVADPATDVQVSYWKDEAAGQHPDAWRSLDVPLKPGVRYERAEPAAYVFVSRGSPAQRPWLQVLAEAAARAAASP